MMHVHHADLGRPDKPASYARKRAVRIYPMYWLVLLGLVALYLALPGMGDPAARDPAAVLYQMTLAPTAQPPILAVAWTLHHEALFYVLFGLMIASRDIGRVALGAWFALSIIGWGWAQSGAALAFPFNVAASPYNLLFGFGMAAAWIAREVRLTHAGALMGLGLVAYLAIGLQDLYAPAPLTLATRTVLFGVAAMSVVIGMVALERARRIGRSRTLKLLGDGSYTIYLAHMPILLVMVNVLERLGYRAEAPSALMFGALFVATVGLCMIAHMVVERPLMRALSRRGPAAPGSMAPA
jgi:peptidoglycan/LPS O-acetylase OafA/YrhL